MNSSAESLLSGFPSGVHRHAPALRIPPSPFGDLVRKLTENPLALFVLGSALIAAHLLIVIFQPRASDGYVYIISAVAAALQAAVLVMHARSNTGQLSLRWGLLALGFGIHCATYLRGSLFSFTGADFPVIQVIFQVLYGCCFVFALTLPSEEQEKRERVLDVSVVAIFCFLRFLFLHFVVPIGSSHSLERMTMESGITVVLAGFALMAAPRSDRTFFRCAMFAFTTDFLAIICSNEIGYTLFHQQTNSPWFLTDTAQRVACTIYFFYALSNQHEKVDVENPRVSLSSVVPFTMTALIVFLSASLVSTRPYVGYTGIVFGVSAFLLRIGFVSRRRQPEIVIEEGLVREIASEIIKDPLYGLADRYGLEPALAYARSSVDVHSPLALILFALEETGNGVEALSEDSENRNLVMIARSLNHWQSSDSTICYLGRGRFAMLLPATPLRIAISLAEQICISLDALDLTGEDGPMAIMAGVAACTEPSRVSNLLRTSSAALERAHVHREARVRTTPLRGEALFDA